MSAVWWGGMPAAASQHGGSLRFSACRQWYLACTYSIGPPFFSSITAIVLVKSHLLPFSYRRAESVCLGELEEGGQPSPRQKSAVEKFKAAAAGAERILHSTEANGHTAMRRPPTHPRPEARLQEERMQVCPSSRPLTLCMSV